MMRTLVIDQSYRPIRVVCWQRALTLVLAERAEVIEAYQGKNVHTVSRTFACPAVIRIFRNAFQMQRVRLARRNIYRRDKWRCGYCSTECPEQELTLDHVKPISQGGGKSWENLVTACRPCNTQKGGRTPEQARMPLAIKPRMPLWSIAYLLPKDHGEHGSGRGPDEWAPFLA